MNDEQRPTGVWHVCPACGRVYSEAGQCDGLPRDAHEPADTHPRTYERSRFTDFDGPTGGGLVATSDGLYDMSDHDLGAFLVQGWQEAEARARVENARYRWVCVNCGRRATKPGQCAGREDESHAPEALREDSIELVEAKWAEIDELLRSGEIAVDDTITMLFEHGLVRKAHGPDTRIPRDADLLWMLEIGRERPMVPGPRIIVAYPGHGPLYAAHGGRIYAPIDRTVRYDTGAYSTEF